MIGNVMPSLVQMDPELLKSIVTEVEETIAMDIEKTDISVRSFGIVDMWNIRRNSKRAGDRFRG